MRLYNFFQSMRLNNPLRLIDFIYLYLIGGFIGTIYENIYYYFYLGRFENHSGSIILPVNVVYGLGVVLIAAFLYSVKGWYKIWIFGGLIAGTTEYIMSFLAENYLGISTWDYRYELWNINGRTTIPYMVLWGLGCLILVVFVLPVIIKGIHHVPLLNYNVVGAFFVGVIIMDWTMSLFAVTRYVQRNEGIYFDSELINWFDSLFHDNFMRERYPNLVFIK